MNFLKRQLPTMHAIFRIRRILLTNAGPQKQFIRFTDVPAISYTEACSQASHCIIFKIHRYLLKPTIKKHGHGQNISLNFTYIYLNPERYHFLI